MRIPFRRTPPRDRQVEQALRHSLADHARRAPAGHDLPDRVFAAVDRTPVHDARRGASRWRTWALPLIAAGGVAAVVGAVAGIQQLDRPSAHRSAAAPPPVPSSSVPSSSVPDATPTVTVSPTRQVSTAHTSKPPVDTSTLHGVKVLDLTFADVDDGWALATADCITGPGRCPAVLRTRSGTRWHSEDIVDFNVPGQTGGCADPCVEHLRFATDDVGYAFGPSSLEMTTDGGQHWSEQSGGALFLETLHQNVIRVTSSGPGCPGPCGIRVQTAPLGSTQWTTQLGPVTGPGAGVQFARGGSDAYLLLTGQVAGGSGDATSLLYRSQDDGATWTQGGEPCPQAGRTEIDSTAVAAGAQGRVAVLCARRGPAEPEWVATSDDHGAHFTAKTSSIVPTAARLLTGDPGTVLLVADRSVERSTDGGLSWSPAREPIVGVTFAGFEDPWVGRVVAADGTEIWTTRDGGRTWTKVRFR